MQVAAGAGERDLVGGEKAEGRIFVDTDITKNLQGGREITRTIFSKPVYRRSLSTSLRFPPDFISYCSQTAISISYPQGHFVKYLLGTDYFFELKLPVAEGWGTNL